MTSYKVRTLYSKTEPIPHTQQQRDIMIFYPIALSLFLACPNKSSAPSDANPQIQTNEETWKCVYLDGSGNTFYFHKISDVIHFRYDPIQPEMSSSGVYSGGTAKKGILNTDQASLLEEQIQLWRTDTNAHVDNRSKGISSFRIRQGESTQTFLIPESQLQSLSVLLLPFRP